MKHAPWILAVALAAVLLLHHAPRPGVAQPAVSADYEYRVLSLVQLFADAPNPEAMRKKIGELMVSVGDVQRTDMDAPDYQEALNRLALDDWEPVTVTKSNYWVFRRPVMQ